jgi:hypothetical protein
MSSATATSAPASTAGGDVESTTGASFTATVHLRKSTPVFSGTIVPAQPAFSVSSAQITYKDASKDFAGQQSWSGNIGPNTIEFDFENGVKITGNLDTPTANPVIVSGSGYWSLKDPEGTRSLASPP